MRGLLGLIFDMTKDFYEIVVKPNNSILDVNIIFTMNGISDCIIWKCVPAVYSLKIFLQVINKTVRSAYRSIWLSCDLLQKKTEIEKLNSQPDK